MKSGPLIRAIAVIVTLVCSFSFSPPHDAGLQADVVAQTNKFRHSKGLPSLISSETLNRLAAEHSANMASGKVAFGHGGFSARSNKASRLIGSLRSFAENVAYGPTTAEGVVDGWKNSPGHRRNMLGKYKYIGVGIARDRRGRLYYTQIFAG